MRAESRVPASLWPVTMRVKQTLVRSGRATGMFKLCKALGKVGQVRRTMADMWSSAPQPLHHVTGGFCADSDVPSLDSSLDCFCRRTLITTRSI